MSNEIPTAIAAITIAIIRLIALPLASSVCF